LTFFSDLAHIHRKYQSNSWLKSPIGLGSY
jgi:hypothetical protein